MIPASIARLRRLTRRQWAVVALVALLAVPVLIPAARWVWRNVIRPRPALERPMLPYGELRVGIDASYPPFGVDLNGELFGLDVDLAHAVAEKLGVPLRLINMGYDGLYDSLRADQTDALFSALRMDPLRMNDVRYTVSYFDAGQVLVRPPDSGIDSPPDLEGLTLAVEFGTEGDLEARRWQRRLHELHIAPFEIAAQALEAVVAGEADAALVDAISARLWLRENQGLEIAPGYVTHDPYAVAVHINNEQLWAAINDALAALSEEGTLDAIIARWL